MFTYSSRQSHVVSALVTAFTIVTSSGLSRSLKFYGDRYSSIRIVSVGLWFMSERWIFSRTRGQRWLFDILNETQSKINKILGITWLLKRWPKDIRERLARVLRVGWHNIKMALKSFYAACTCRKADIEEAVVHDKERQAHLSDFASPPMSPDIDHPTTARSEPDSASIADTNYSGLPSPRIFEKRPALASESMGSIPSSSSGQPRDSPSTSNLPIQNNGQEGEQRPNNKRLKSVVERVSVDELL